MTSQYRIQRAGEHDLAEVMAVLEGRREWLRDVKESDQWANVDQWRALVRHLIRRGKVWVLVIDDDGAEIVGTITLDRDPDFDFWSDAQRRQSALYVSKLATASRHAGHALGELMLDWAIDRASRLGMERIRLDTWRTSPQLQDYYVKRNWRMVGVVEVEYRQSGALFERDAEPIDRGLVEWEERGLRVAGAMRPEAQAQPPESEDVRTAFEPNPLVVV